MTKLGVPVPPGFTISTSACRFYLEYGAIPESLDEELESALGWLELEQAQRFGSESDPLLVSVRSGASISMPGMMDTILNIGINDANLVGLAAKHENVEFALDSYRRLLQMFGSVVLQVPKQAFDRAIQGSSVGLSLPVDCEEASLRRVVAAFQNIIEQHIGRPFPLDPRSQLRQAVEAVFQSWNNERARHYRRINGIGEDFGTAVTVQAMVFGNYGFNSGTGVGFTRNPSTGEREMFAEFLPNAQGEDIVAGIRTPMPISELEQAMPQVYQQLRSVTTKLETHYRDVQDFEFTVQKGELFLLQTRSASCSALAKIRTAVEMADEGLISRRPKPCCACLQRRSRKFCHSSWIWAARRCRRLRRDCRPLPVQRWASWPSMQTVRSSLRGNTRNHRLSWCGRRQWPMTSTAWMRPSAF